METQFALVYLEILEKSLCKTEQEFVGVHNLNSLKIPFSQSSTCLHHFLHMMLWGSTCVLNLSLVSTHLAGSCRSLHGGGWWVSSCHCSETVALLPDLTQLWMLSQLHVCNVRDKVLLEVNWCWTSFLFPVAGCNCSCPFQIHLSAVCCNAWAVPEQPRLIMSALLGLANLSKMWFLTLLRHGSPRNFPGQPCACIKSAGLMHSRRVLFSALKPSEGPGADKSSWFVLWYPSTIGERVSPHQGGLVPGRGNMKLLVLPGPDAGFQHLHGLAVPSISTPGLLLCRDVLYLHSIKMKRGKAAPWVPVELRYRISAGICVPALPSCNLAVDVQNWQIAPVWHQLQKLRYLHALEWAAGLLEELWSWQWSEVKQEPGPAASS